jgi:hypothetical protein
MAYQGRTTAAVETPERILLDTKGSDGTFSIPVTGTYTVIEVTGFLRSDVAAITDNIKFKFNADDTAANYQLQNLRNTASNTAGGEQANTNVAITLPGNSAPNGRFGLFRLVLYGPALTAHKQTVITWAHAPATAVGSVVNSTLPIAAESCFLWESTAAVTAIDITPSSGTNFKTGSSILAIGYRSQNLVVGV